MDSPQGVSVSSVSRKALTVSYIIFLGLLCVILVVFFSKTETISLDMNEHSLDPTALYYTSIQDPQRQSTLGPDTGVLEMSDPQYVCSNDTSLGGTCTSGERVVRARGLCSKCIALGVGSENTGETLFNRGIAPAFTPEESLALQNSLQSNNGFLELADYQYVCRNDNSKHGRGCYSGEKVSRANQACSKCQAERRYEAYPETATDFDEDLFMPDHE